jgi:hypothetical protein
LKVRGVTKYDENIRRESRENSEKWRNHGNTLRGTPMDKPVSLWEQSEWGPKVSYGYDQGQQVYETNFLENGGYLNVVKLTNEKRLYDQHRSQGSLQSCACARQHATLIRVGLEVQVLQVLGMSFGINYVPHVFTMIMRLCACIIREVLNAKMEVYLDDLLLHQDPERLANIGLEVLFL